MNRSFQFESRPDAESLNAFAEQALAERERGQILAHLAVCGRCRQVVALAQSAAAEPVAPAVYSAIRPASWRRSWRWAPAAALAAMVALAFLVHIGRRHQGAELARVEPQAARQGNIFNPSAPPRETVPASPAPARSAAKSLKPAAPGAVSQPISQGFLASAARSSEAETVERPAAGQNEAALLPGASGPESLAHGTAVQFKPEAWQQQQMLRAAQSHDLAARAMLQARANAVSGRAQASRILTAAAPAPQNESEAVSPVTIEVSKQKPMAAFAAPFVAKTVVLPSGLLAVSTVTARHRTLSLDAAGTLFLGEAAGSRWERVARQWTGRAVAVRIQRALDGNLSATLAGGGANQEFSGPGAPLSPAAAFEIVNDKDLVWVSLDGRTWEAKQK
jgi:hypothetical protein